VNPCKSIQFSTHIAAPAFPGKRSQGAPHKHGPQETWHWAVAKFCQTLPNFANTVNSWLRKYEKMWENYTFNTI
jgi:hypothetical protein